MKLMVTTILATVTIVLVAVLSINGINSAEKCRVVVDSNEDKTVNHATIRFGNESWGGMDETEKATLLNKCIKAIGSTPGSFMLYAKDQKTDKLVFTHDSEKGLVEVGEHAK